VNEEIAYVHQKWRPSIRLILLALNLTVLMLPIAGLLFFRIYENQLVRETERKLTAQASILAAVFKRSLQEELGNDIGQVTRRIMIAASTGGDKQNRQTLPQINAESTGHLKPQPTDVMHAGPLYLRLHKAAQATMTILKATQSANSPKLQLLDANGRIIEGPLEEGLSLARVTEIRRALTGQYASAVRQQSSENLLPGLTSIGRSSGARVFVGFPAVENGQLYGIIYLSQTPDSIWQRLYDARRKITIAIAVLLAVTITLVLAISRTIIGPIDTLNRQAALIARGRHTIVAPIKRSGTSEIAGLANSIVSMANTLNQRTRYLRAFAVTVGHEFKAPVTAIHGAAELMLEDVDNISVADRKLFLSNIRADAYRIEKLINRLNELARADNPLQNDNVINIMAALQQFANTYENVELDLTVTGSNSAYAYITVDALELMASNLCTNAAQAGAQHCTMTVDNDPAHGLIRISFLDDGPGIDEVERERVFKPFHTTRREAGGTGLGLPIVQSLAQAYGGTVSLHDSTMGAHFVIDLPHAQGT